MRVIPTEQHSTTEPRPSSAIPPVPSYPSSHQGYALPGQFLPSSPTKQPPSSILPTISPNRHYGSPKTIDTQETTSVFGSFTAGIQKTLQFDPKVEDDMSELSTKRSSGYMDWVYGSVKSGSDKVMGIWSDATHHELEIQNSKDSDSFMKTARKHWLFKAIRQSGDQLYNLMSNSTPTHEDGHLSDGVYIQRGSKSQSKQLLPFNNKDVQDFRY